MQPARKQSAARRATAGLAVANSREHNNADGCFLAGPKGASQIDQCRVAVLEKGMPFPADCALPWPIWDALHPSILSCSTTSSAYQLSSTFCKLAIELMQCSHLRCQIGVIIAIIDNVVGARKPLCVTQLLRQHAVCQFVVNIVTFH